MSFEWLDETIEVNCKVVPATFIKTRARNFYKERFDLYFVCSWGKYYPAFGLDYKKPTFVRSLITSSILQGKAGKK